MGLKKAAFVTPVRVSAFRFCTVTQSQDFLTCQVNVLYVLQNRKPVKAIGAKIAFTLASFTTNLRKICKYTVTRCI